jgi:hypothetical protein
MRRLTLAVWLLTAAPAFPQTVELHVVNSSTGDGIPGVALIVLREGQRAFTGATDTQGRARIENLSEGDYSLTYTLQGFRPARDPAFAAFKIASGIEPLRMEFAMTPLGRISGRVLDAAGNPVPKASLESDKVGHLGTMTQLFQADDKGEFHEQLLPGSWSLSAIAPSSWPPPEAADGPARGYTQTYYPGVTDPSIAAKIVVPAGGEIAHLEVKLAAVLVHRIRGVVLDSNGEPASKLDVTLSGSGLVIGAKFHQTTGGDGTFDFPSAGDGAWLVSATSNKDGVKLWASHHLQVTGHDSDNIELRLGAPFAIRGRIVLDVPDGMPAPKMPRARVEPNIQAFGDIPNGALQSAKPDERGEFTIANLYPGEPYHVWPEAAPAPYYLDSIQIGGRDALGWDTQFLPGMPPLIITYKRNGGTVRGTVEGCGAGDVMLMPQDPAWRSYDFSRQTKCTQNDRFEMTAVRPGEYYGLAIAASDDGGPVNLDQNLINQSVRVTVRAGEATNADLRLVKR